MRVQHNVYVHTYSIIAADLEAGLLGGAVQSHYFGAASSVLWAEPGIGVVATQALVNVEYGPKGLSLLRQGKTPAAVIAKLTGNDGGSALRQLAVLDCTGRVAAHTGSRCIREAGHRTGECFAVQANMMLKNTVWDAMYETFKASSIKGLRLRDRLLAALEAAEREGGDIRGRQAAGIVIVQSGKGACPAKGKIMDIRVEDNPEPLQELRRLMAIHSAYRYADIGDSALESGNIEKAMDAYKKAESLLPDNIELRYWHAVALANRGDFENAARMLKKIFQEDAKWEELTRRLPESGLAKFSLKDIGIQ